MARQQIERSGAAWLERTLANGDRKANEMIQGFISEGLSRSLAYRVKRRVGAWSYRKDGEWWWSLKPKPFSRFEITEGKGDSR